MCMWQRLWNDDGRDPRMTPRQKKQGDGKRGTFATTDHVLSSFLDW